VITPIGLYRFKTRQTLLEVATAIGISKTKLCYAEKGRRVGKRTDELIKAFLANVDTPKLF